MHETDLVTTLRKEDVAVRSDQLIGNVTKKPLWKGAFLFGRWKLEIRNCLKTPISAANFKIWLQTMQNSSTDTLYTPPHSL